MLSNLWKISSKLTSITLKIQIVQSCILTYIDYCNSLYVCLPKKQIRKLQKLLNAAVRFVFNLSYWEEVSITEYSKRCHFLPVQARVEFKVCLLVYKCLNDMAPDYLKDLVTTKQSLPSLRVSQDNHLLAWPPLEVQNYKNRKFSLAAPKLWNKLPLDIRKSNSLTIFKSQLKTHLFNVYYNS